MAAAGALLAAIGISVFAEKAYGTLQPPAAFVDAYVYACEPVEYDFAGVGHDLSDAGRQVYDDLFLKEHGGSCREFYYGELVPRLDVADRPYFLPVGL